MVGKTKSNSAVLEKYFDESVPFRLLRARPVMLMVLGALMLIAGDASMAIGADVVPHPLALALIGAGVCIGLVGTLMFLSPVLDQWNAIKFIRERIHDRFEQFPQSIDAAAETYRFSGFSVFNTDCSGKAQVVYAGKSLYTDVFEVNVVAVHDDQLTIYTRRTHLSSADYSVDSSVQIPQASITDIAIREVVLDAPAGKEHKTGLFRYLEIATADGAKYNASLSHFDPIDERHELDFGDEVAALKSTLNL
jgi:hypothetical protein